MAALDTLDENDSSNGWPSYVPSQLPLGNPASPVNTGVTTPAPQGLGANFTPPAPNMVPTGAPSAPELTPTQKYQKALQDYEDILKKQANLGSQVPWFQMAAGFLDPGRTGSFGESLGKAAGAISQYQSEQQKNAIPLAKARLELMQSGYGLERQVAAEKDFAKLIGGKPSSTIAPADSGPHNPADPAAPEALTKTGTKVDPTDAVNATPITMTHVLAFAQAHPEAKEQISMLFKAAEMNQPNIAVTTGGDFYNTKTGQVIGSTTALKQEPTQTPFGDFNLTSQQYKTLLQLPGQDEQKKYLVKLFGSDAQGNPITASAAAGLAEANKARNVKTQEASVKAEEKLAADAIVAMHVLPVLDRVQALAKQIPKDQFGILGKGDVAEALAALSKPGSNGDTSDLFKALRKAKASDNIINLFNDIDAQIGVAEQEYMNHAGAGATRSDYRVKFFQSIHPNSMKDMAGAFDAKVNEFKNRYDWEIKTHQMYHDANDERASRGLPRMTVDGFMTSKPYIDAYNQYRKEYAEGAPARSSIAPVQPVKPASPAPAAPPVVKGDDDPVYKKLQPGQQYIYNGVVKTKG